MILLGKSVSNSGWETIVLAFRVPKAITAVLAGSGLSVCGLLMQTMFRNPLAGPFVLGISSGASLGAALLILSGSLIGISMLQLSLLGSWTVVLASMIGAFSVLTLILIISNSIRDSMTLLIIGLMVGSLSAGLVSVLQYYSEAEEIQSFLMWTFGNLGGVHGIELEVLGFTVFLGLLGTVGVLKPLDALLLGESYAASLGVNIRAARFQIIIITSVLAGGITAFCGPLAFIGIAIPHLARMLFKTADHRILVPGCILLGAIVLCLCDLLSQIPGRSQVLPINAITSLIGAPAVIAILVKSRSLSKSF
jgi:iron complex transport system permease protein